VHLLLLLLLLLALVLVQQHRQWRSYQDTVLQGAC
jgi:hypothetical protein